MMQGLGLLQLVKRHVSGQCDVENEKTKPIALLVQNMGASY